MRNLLIVFLVLTILLMILFCPIKIRLMAHLDLLKKKVFYSLKIIFIRVLCGWAYVNNEGKFVIENSINIIKQNSNKDLIMSFLQNFLKRLDVNKIEIFFTGGLADDSYSSAILCGTFSAGIETLYSILSQMYDDVKLYEDVSPTFNQSNFELTFDVVIKINLFSLIVSIIKASLANNSFKEMKNEGRL